MKPTITRSKYNTGSSLGNELFTYFINFYNINESQYPDWNYTMVMSEEGFFRLCQSTGWKLTEE